MNITFPEGRILFRFTPNPEDDITGYDQVGTEQVVIEEPKADGGVVIYGKSSRTGEWLANFGERHVIKRLLEMMMAVHMQHDEPCRLDHHGFCQSHLSGPPCLYAEIKQALADVRLPIGEQS